MSFRPGEAPGQFVQQARSCASSHAEVRGLALEAAEPLLLVHRPRVKRNQKLAFPDRVRLYCGRARGIAAMNTADYHFLTMSRYRFRIALLDRSRLPEYKGGTLRGAFGHVFKRVVCSARRPSCDGCILTGTCPYTYIFDTRRPDGARIMRLYPQVPRPFVLEPPLDRRRQLEPGDELEFGLILIGKAVSHLPYFVFTFQQMGNTGIGIDRARFELRSVVSDPPSGPLRQVYSARDRKVQGSPAFVADELVVPTDRGTVALTFQTPLRLQGDGTTIERLEFRPLVSGLLRRISALAYFHCGHEFHVDFKELVEGTDAVRVERDETRWYEWDRFSGRQHRRLSMGGLIGSITFSGDLREYWPLLQIGEVIHVGKATAFGLGKFQLNALHSETQA